MITEVRVDLTCFYERQPWGIIYLDCDEVVDSDYCDDAQDCIESIKSQADVLDSTCQFNYLIPATTFGIGGIEDVMDEVNSYLAENELI